MLLLQPAKRDTRTRLRPAKETVVIEEIVDDDGAAGARADAAASVQRSPLTAMLRNFLGGFSPMTTVFLVNIALALFLVVFISFKLNSMNERFHRVMAVIARRGKM